LQKLQKLALIIIKERLMHKQYSKTSSIETKASPSNWLF